MQMVRILIILPVGIENLEKLAWIARILHSSGQGLANWGDFAQFTANSVNQKTVCEFHVICLNGGLFGYFGGVSGFLTALMCANGMDFASFII